MSVPACIDVIEVFRAFLARYPDMRLGQAVCNVAEWDDFHADNVPDEQLARQARQHLERRFGEDATLLERSVPLEDWAVALAELRRLEPAVPLGKLLNNLAKRAGTTLYDIENEELTAMARLDAAVPA